MGGYIGAASQNVFEAVESSPYSWLGWWNAGGKGDLPIH
jgi:hypothetical protein